MWLFRNVARRCLVVAFRGTEQVKWRDLLTDVLVAPSPFNPERAASGELGLAALFTRPSPPQVERFLWVLRIAEAVKSSFLLT